MSSLKDREAALNKQEKTAKDVAYRSVLAAITDGKLDGDLKKEILAKAKTDKGFDFTEIIQGLLVQAGQRSGAARRARLLLSELCDVKDLTVKNPESLASSVVTGLARRSRRALSSIGEGTSQHMVVVQKVIKKFKLADEVRHIRKTYAHGVELLHTDDPKAAKPSQGFKDRLYDYWYSALKNT